MLSKKFFYQSKFKEKVLVHKSSHKRPQKYYVLAQILREIISNAFKNEIQNWTYEFMEELNLKVLRTNFFV